MISIDEAIMELKTSNYLTNSEKLQIAEWLEELKVLRLGANELRNAGYEHGHSIGYNNAIDDFQDWLKTQIVGIDNKTKEILIVVDDRWELATDKFKESERYDD